MVEELVQPMRVESYPRSWLQNDLLRIVVEHLPGLCSEITIEDRRGAVVARRQRSGHLSLGQAQLDFALSYFKYETPDPDLAYDCGLLLSLP